MQSEDEEICMLANDMRSSMNILANQYVTVVERAGDYISKHQGSREANSVDRCMNSLDEGAGILKIVLPDYEPQRSATLTRMSSAERLNLERELAELERQEEFIQPNPLRIAALSKKGGKSRKIGKPSRI